MDRSAKNGFRCALYPDPSQTPSASFEMEKLVEPRDFYAETPVTDPIFQVYREQFSYDKTDLKGQVESRQESPGGWIRERITFDAAYSGERIIAHLFLPRNTPPPYQTVIYSQGAPLYQSNRARTSKVTMNSRCSFLLS